MELKLQKWPLAAWRRWEARLQHCAEPECKAAGWASRFFPRRAGIQLQEEWYCSPQCFEAAARRRYMRAEVAVLAAPRVQHRIPLGLLMLSRGQLDNTQLRAALAAQQKHGFGRIGSWLEKMGYASEQQITAALGLQWACPVVPPSSVSNLNCATLLPLRLMQHFRMLPVYFSKAGVMHVAFSEGIDYTALYAIEQMLQCHTEASVLSSRAMDLVLERIAHGRRSGELLFEGWRDKSEMARITCSYVLKLGARLARIVVCGDHIWTRLRYGQETTDLVFRRCPANEELTC